jgi:hypothetical protein
LDRDLLDLALGSGFADEGFKVRGLDLLEDLWVLFGDHWRPGHPWRYAIDPYAIDGPLAWKDGIAQGRGSKIVR